MVDQDNETRERLAAPLKRDYRVLRASSGGAGAAILTKEEVDVLVADVELPGISGIDLLQMVARNFPLIEIIMTSSSATWTARCRRSSSAPITS